ncbi:uncharacterized protein NECHADRAFT_79345 [Fusarium vanettenii 77-13-4]|uniref:Uncharacterized protein n=1 Tax=Fusarium vanettenii (strain ATCC MYA-4622 / CBS 123669 / FGSC 9596 / NRRL 45880 / 77-13-4) TaxID=660122 RepID=C7YNL2_FUSV7|nr:uncharacterized protein NECHADRAFT_79345 [Fusarium vanettenii 77-13-4]EEU46589.1 predicted protein [Fusarium vanettenii 77-13-4]
MERGEGQNGREEAWEKKVTLGFMGMVSSSFYTSTPSLSSHKSVTPFSLSSGISLTSTNSRMLYMRCLLQYSSSSTRRSRSISSIKRSSSSDEESPSPVDAPRRHKRPPK